MNALDLFLTLTPHERVLAILKSREDFPRDPRPAMRCISNNPDETFCCFDDEVSTEIGAYIKLLGHLGQLDVTDIEAVARAGELYVIAIATIRICAAKII
ncbi:hypothetical protein SCD_n01188 [Sulfuricella denitrificans skB26]|uniref:Uncharacterized protein n=1 Tax=Sulfuricella denitrificans (strain DSM 22764 / NBRC 105220 / skB26) TaxID=1163617 RepID=S6B2W9_SULDS|nr:hypothetical protein [Sulfuricella denitrificans]BAN35017.1 hypothetical protein SCD_n01188 [Sulfuricella denitrificans skB26]